MQLRTGRYDGVDLTDIPKEDLVKILANSTNAGSPFTQKEIDAVKAEIAARVALEPVMKPESESESASEPEPKPKKGKGKKKAVDEDEGEESDD